MVDKYVYAVTHLLPEKGRKDAEKEVRALIEKRLKDRVKKRKATEQDIEAVLMELGDPGCLAPKFGGSGRYLIGPELFDTYWTILKIVGLSALIALSVIFAIDLAVSPLSIIERSTEFIFSVITGGVQVFGWVTIVFFLLNYAGRPYGYSARPNSWTPANLRSVPNPVGKINPIEPTVGIIFSVLFMVLFTFSRDQIGIHIVNSEQSRIILPFFNEVAIREILPYLYILFTLGVLKEFIKWLAKEWTFKLVFLMVFFNGVAFFIASEIFTKDTFWNQDFINSLVQHEIIMLNDASYQLISEIWNQITEGLFLLIAAALIIDTLLMFIKVLTVKVSEKNKAKMAG